MTIQFCKPDIKDVAAHYDGLGEFYPKTWGEELHFGYWPQGKEDLSLHEAQKVFTDEMIRRTPIVAGQKLLDVGCGIGKPAIHLAKAKGCFIQGISVSGFQVKRANELAQKEGLSHLLKFSNVDAMNMPYENEYFDSAWAFESLFHMPDRAHVLREIVRVLKPGATFVATDIFPISTNFSEDEQSMLNQYGIGSAETLEDYPGILQSAGFEVVEVSDVHVRVKPTMPKFRDITIKKWDELVDMVGLEFMEDLKAKGCPVAIELFDKKLGMLILVAKKA